MALQVFTAVTGAAWESELVGALDRADHGVTVVRRCVDVSELLAVAATGTGQAALLSAELRRLDGDAVARLEAAGVAVVGLVEPGDERGRGPAPPARGPPGAAGRRRARGDRPGAARGGGGRSRAGAGRRRPAGGAAGARSRRSSREEQPGRARPGRRRLGADRRAGADDRRGRHRRRGRPAGGRPRCWSTPTCTAASSRRCWGCSTSRPGWRARRGWPASGRARRAGAGPAGVVGASAPARADRARAGRPVARAAAAGGGRGAGGGAPAGRRSPSSTARSAWRTTRSSPSTRRRRGATAPPSRCSRPPTPCSA